MTGRNHSSKVLIVEDTLSVSRMHTLHMQKAGIESDLAQTGAEAIDKLVTGQFSTVLLDLQLPDMNGLEIMTAVKKRKIPVTFIVVTSNGSVNTAVKAMQNGAYDFLIKPVAPERLVTSVKNALERTDLWTTVKVLKKDMAPRKIRGFVGDSIPMLAIYTMIENIAHSKAPVFITGESGTGKEVCAQSIHEISGRSGQNFVAINCAAIPMDLMESEIFGHVKGAYTGAQEARDGAAFRADGGTLFLDEICEMDIGLQAKLLRFLQTGKIKKVGSDKLIDVDVRIVCATNRNPRLEVAEKRFREDLFYRLDVLSLTLPPLREREDDVILLAEHFMQVYAKEEGKAFDHITDAAKSALLNYDWPGNIREVQNTIRKAVIMNSGTEINADMLDLSNNLVIPNIESTQRDESAYQPYRSIGPVSDPDASVLARPTIRKPLTIDLDRPMAELERQIIEAAISACGGSIPKASKILELSPSTIYRKRESWSDEGEGDDFEQPREATIWSVA